MLQYVTYLWEINETHSLDYDAYNVVSKPFRSSTLFEVQLSRTLYNDTTYYDLFASATTCTCIEMISINLIRALHKDDLLHYKEWWKITLFWMKEYLWIRYGLHEYAKKKKLIPLLIRKEIKLKVNKWTLIFDYRLGISFVVWKTGSCIHAFVSTDKNL